MSRRAAIVLGTVFSSLACVAGCTANVGAPEESASSTNEALVTCNFNALPDCTREGVNGQLLCSCDPISPTGPVPGACSGRIAIPAGLAGKGCTAGTWIHIYNEGYTPLWECPAGVSLPLTLGVVAGGASLPPCVIDSSGNPVQPADGSTCAWVMKSPLMADSCVANAESGWTYVAERQIAHVYIGTNCGGGCSKLAGP
jgi:hypothetical protein